MNSRTRTIYLAGPMRGFPDFNYPEFRRVAGMLRGLGHEVYNPAEFAHDGPLDQFPVRKAFSEYCNIITRHADTIVLLPGWPASVGATAEHALARVCGLDIIEWTEDGTSARGGDVMDGIDIAPLKKQAKEADAKLFAMTVDPRVVLALIDRVEKAEAAVEKSMRSCEQSGQRLAAWNDEREFVSAVLGASVGYGLPLRQRAELARAEIARLRDLLVGAWDALMFYGDVSKYPAPLTGGMGDLWSDCGNRARAIAREIEEAIGKC